ncbi:hypothetical protein MBM_03583 [Drepanopeziza brunnea f. sp. 'multigermtubi' MB_m1]|uniref:Uncharacterized protein n=2 Tax=Drepanopeziza brunnea f. sp. 'multigermtubi' TaxID=698441 RepID=K1WLK5_MARBU|nr:uncharacterized protein MBM_03583 [Drepanopeziza brunnea f. sp. 'multigermtubi' MB_m1]EKD18590.1 hypothetical protein MBM_03583 [Drepanopeziza brunnea f. sp. 'multigermtubi' MB_m1]
MCGITEPEEFRDMLSGNEKLCIETPSGIYMGYTVESCISFIDTVMVMNTFVDAASPVRMRFLRAVYAYMPWRAMPFFDLRPYSYSQVEAVARLLYDLETEFRVAGSFYIDLWKKGAREYRTQPGALQIQSFDMRLLDQIFVSGSVARQEEPGNARMPNGDGWGNGHREPQLPHDARLPNMQHGNQKKGPSSAIMVDGYGGGVAGQRLGNAGVPYGPGWGALNWGANNARSQGGYDNSQRPGNTAKLNRYAGDRAYGGPNSYISPNGKDNHKAGKEPERRIKQEQEEKIGNRDQVSVPQPQRGGGELLSPQGHSKLKSEQERREEYQMGGSGQVSIKIEAESD